MAQAEKTTKATQEGGTDAAAWKPTAEAKKKATTLRIIAIVLWVVAIAAEAGAIFWLLRQREAVGGSGESGLSRDAETGLLVDEAATYEFPQWAFITLIVVLVVIAALSIIGSMLWKKANRLDPASQKDTFRFFVQNQLGAILAVLAFLPLIIMVFLNKDMSKGQKGLAGTIAIILAVVATALGADFNPASVEKYTAEQSTVIQLLGEDRVHWVAGGSVYHVCADVPDIANASSEAAEGTTAEAVEAGKNRLTLELASELKACGLPVPENISGIVDAIREIRDGGEGVVLPQPVYADGVEAPFTPVASGS
ncbi:hypothetical protein [Salinibacterium sp. ZJ77]|uniref:hypothetical protein n=1 Tax=Salinibacterium sp. ZJ77 TaxID=2708337 RepID=UPI00142358F2|nr:hypothetical protein [Salinibacterium sp. ZJ77]